jgi:ABC-type branched-subunit amino acid transport system ATPase component
VTAPILEVQGLTKRFGGVVALNRIDLGVPTGRIHGLIGPNGAGKSTLFNVITGVFQPDSGTVRFDGREVNGASPHRLVELGMVRTFQKVHPFRGMTVLESVMVGRHARSRAGLLSAVAKLPGVAAEERGIRDRAHAALAFVRLEGHADDPAESLPLGLHRLLQLACALAAEPRLLLLDEPASGLNTSETAQLADLLRAIRRQGSTIVLVEHDMSLVMKVSDQITVLNFGHKLAEGTPEEVRRSPEVIRAYLGAGNDSAGR